MSSLGVFSLVSNEWQQSHKSGALDGDSQHSLILGGCAGDSSWSDLSGWRDVLLQEFGILVIDMFDMVLCEITELSLWFNSAEHVRISFPLRNIS